DLSVNAPPSDSVLEPTVSVIISAPLVVTICFTNRSAIAPVVYVHANPAISSAKTNRSSDSRYGLHLTACLLPAPAGSPRFASRTISPVCASIDHTTHRCGLRAWARQNNFSGEVDV